MFKKLYFILPLLALIGCGAYTSIKSSKSPNFQGKVYRKILVDTQGLNVASELELEWAFKNKFEKDGNIQVALASDLFPPSKTFTDDEKRTIAIQQQIEGILIIQFTGQETVQRVVPPGPVQTEIKKDGKGNTTVTTHQDPGYVDEDEKKYHELTLLDTSDFKPVWIGFANTTGDYGFIKSFVAEVFSKMAKEGLIQKKN